MSEKTDTTEVAPKTPPVAPSGTETTGQTCAPTSDEAAAEAPLELLPDSAAAAAAPLPLQINAIVQDAVAQTLSALGVHPNGTPLAPWAEVEKVLGQIARS